MSNFLFMTVKTHCCDVGQCYDGAGAMKGRRAGLKTLVQQENPLALYVHCYAHCLQLAVQDLTKSLPVIQSALDITSEIAKLIKSSPKRESMLNTLTSSIEGPSVRMRTLCPTRLVLHTRTDVKLWLGTVADHSLFLNGQFELGPSTRSSSTILLYYNYGRTWSTRQLIRMYERELLVLVLE